MKLQLNIERLKDAAKEFCKTESKFHNEALFGVTDGKAIGTYIEHKFQAYLEKLYDYEKGSSAKGIDLPSNEINTDIKVTSIKQPQSSCPFKDAKQKIFGLGYNLLIFVYDKTDDIEHKTTMLNIVSCTFIEAARTADYTMTYRIREMIKDGANQEDIAAYLNDSYMITDEMTLTKMAAQILQNPPLQGYWVAANPLQWRFQYSHIVNLGEEVSGISKLINIY